MINYATVILSITIIITLIITLSMKKKNTTLYKLFKILFVLILIFILAVLVLTIFKDNVNDVNSLMHIDSLSYIATCNLPVIFLFISLKYWNKNIRLKKYLWLFIVPIISLIIIFTNDFHHLFCQQYSIDVSKVRFGTYFYVHTIYTYLLLIIAFAIIIKSSIDKSGFLSVGTILIIIGALAPIIPSILGVSQTISIDTYVTPIMFLITAICFYISIFKLKVLDTVPVALKNIMDIMTDAFIVIEKDGSVGYINKTYYDKIFKIINIKTGENFYNIIEKNEMINSKEIMKHIEASKHIEKATTYKWNVENNNIKEYFEIDFQPIKTPKGKKEYIGTLLIFRDITEHTLNQEIISKQAQLVILGQLAGGMAHDINTPISAIDYSIDFLQTEIKDENIQEMLKRMKNCSIKIIDIVNSMRNQIRNLGNTEKIWFNLNELMKDITAITHNELQRTHCFLELDIEDKLEIYGEKNKFGQVIINLIVNSSQAYEVNNISGKIIIKAYSKDKEKIIEVIDNANGIPKSLQDSIFKEILTTKGTKGTGIGLSIAYSVIKGEFGGEMSFITEEGKGTTFIIKIKNGRNDKDEL